MSAHEFYETELTDIPWDTKIDQKALHEGCRHFWSNSEITGFKRDKNGEYVRDEDGKLIAYRTNKQRVMTKDWFNNLHNT
tara:strand:+ start:138 stop:377 length:240 start_codon:yes stop_codon:yes gene_type:complete